MEGSPGPAAMDPAEAARSREEQLRESRARWNAEREKNEEYIAQLRANKEARKREIEEQEQELHRMKEEAEAEAARAEEEERKLEENDKKASTESKEAKPTADDNTKKNFADQKTKAKSSGDECGEALAAAIKPFDVSALDCDQLRGKIAELYDIFANLVADKIQLNTRLVAQEREMVDLRMKRDEILDARAAKKGGIDMEKFYPGKKSKHPPKKTIFSKFDNRKGTRSYDERKDMYDAGTDVIRPQMLVSVWEEKFHAWLSANPSDE